MTLLTRTKPLAEVVRRIVSRDNGAWLDASDMSTMYQDAAGTIPVTAMEQPVGLWLDKSGNGNHATQSITASRPVISARKNLLTKTEDFENAAWTKGGAGTATIAAVTNGYAAAPDGSQTACRLQMALNGGTTTSDRSWLAQQPTPIAGTQYTTSVWVRSNTSNSYVVQLRLGLVASLITVDQQWRQYQYQAVPGGDATHWLALRGAQGTSDSADILIWHPQYEFGPTATSYQRVNTSADYDTAGFQKYLKFDGVDDYLNLPYMGLYANGNASVITASALLRQATNACTISEGNTADADSLYCMARQLASGGNLDSTIIRDDATTLLDTVGSASALADGVASVRGFVDTGSGVKLVKNSAQLTSDAYARSGAVTLNATTIGAKVGTVAALFNNLMLYGMVISKSALSDADRRKCEVYLGRKAGVQL